MPEPFVPLSVAVNTSEQVSHGSIVANTSEVKADPSHSQTDQSTETSDLSSQQATAPTDSSTTETDPSSDQNNIVLTEDSKEANVSEESKEKERSVSADAAVSNDNSNTSAKKQSKSSSVEDGELSDSSVTGINIKPKFVIKDQGESGTHYDLSNKNVEFITWTCTTEPSYIKSPVTCMSMSFSADKKEFPEIGLQNCNTVVNHKGKLVSVRQGSRVYKIDDGVERRRKYTITKTYPTKSTGLGDWAINCARQSGNSSDSQTYSLRTYQLSCSNKPRMSLSQTNVIIPTANCWLICVSIAFYFNVQADSQSNDNSSASNSSTSVKTVAPAPGTRVKWDPMGFNYRYQAQVPFDFNVPDFVLLRWFVDNNGRWQSWLAAPISKAIISRNRERTNVSIWYMKVPCNELVYCSEGTLNVFEGLKNWSPSKIAKAILEGKSDGVPLSVGVSEIAKFSHSFFKTWRANNKSSRSNSNNKNKNKNKDKNGGGKKSGARSRSRNDKNKGGKKKLNEESVKETSKSNDKQKSKSNKRNGKK